MKTVLFNFLTVDLLGTLLQTEPSRTAVLYELQLLSVCELEEFPAYLTALGTEIKA